ncbi:MAG: glycoside hydrolase [Ruminococcaceae bacterium]|nr:glycoside hydrolase [Oscillospiraceae bacterium]
MKNYLGMFVHWGIYSQLEDHEQVLAKRDMDNAEYEKLAKTFNPVRYDPKEWVKLAQAAGMKYICFTTKHHDGFCMWDTKQTDYNIMNTPYGRDVLKMLADACAKYGMKLSLYYSIPDWHEPCAYNPASSHQWKAIAPEKSDTVAYRAFVREQIRELLTGYGEIYTLFWDIPPMIDDPSMNAFVRSLQPQILINDRGYDAGDFSTPERDLPKEGHFPRMTEACQSVGMQSWGYRRDEDYFTPRFLMYSIDRIMASGGSYLLNVGPKPDGTICPEAQASLRRIGEWYNKMEGTLEDTEADPFSYEIRANQFMPGGSCIALKKNGKTYFHFPAGLATQSLYLKKYPGIPKRVRLINTGMTLDTREDTPPYMIVENGIAKGPLLRITGIPSDREPLLTEPTVIEVEW